MIGKVYKSTGSWYKVKNQQGDFIDCCIKGKLRTRNIKSTNPVVVGDEVIYHLQSSDDKDIGVITEINQRRNFIVRKSVNLSKKIHVLASNIDKVFLVITIKNPLTTTVFIDRFLLMAQAYGVETVLIFNKIDSYDESTMEQLDGWMDLYVEIGYKCIKTSALTGEGVEDLKKENKNKLCMFSGHSGVGKSNLINALDSCLRLKIGKMSDFHEQGRHTTTFAEMFDLGFGGSIIDTPGIRGLGIVNIKNEEIANYFMDFFKLKNLCKYDNCKHLEEPDCAVKQAVIKGDIAQSRYDSYLQIITEEDAIHR